MRFWVSAGSSGRYFHVYDATDAFLGPEMASGHRRYERFVRGVPAFFQPDGRLGARRGVRDGASAASSIPESPTPRARSTTPRASSVEPRASTPPVFFPLPALSPSSATSATTASATGRSPPVTPTPTPALPLVFYPILSSLSIAMFILMLSLMGVILDSRYSCDQYTKVGVALLGVTVIYFVDIVLYWLLVYMGWRGTPLNESKRMPQMAILGMWLISILDGRKNSSLGHHHHHNTT